MLINNHHRASSTHSFIASDQTPFTFSRLLIVSLPNAMFGSGISSTEKKSEEETVMRAASMFEDMSKQELEHTGKLDSRLVRKIERPDGQAEGQTCKREVKSRWKMKPPSLHTYHCYSMDWYSTPCSPCHWRSRFDHYYC